MRSMQRSVRDRLSGPDLTRRRGLLRCGDRGDGAERGASSSIQYAVLMPALMLIIFGMIQAGIYLQARNVVGAAANAAADVARSYHGDRQQAREAAFKITAVGGLDDVSVTVNRHHDSVSVRVSGSAPTLIDLGLARVRASADAPLERVSQP